MATTRKTPESITFGNRLREARLNSSYPARAELAQKAGISIDSLKRYENGYAQPSGPVLTKLCNALAVDPAWLYGMYPQEKAVQCPLMEAVKQPMGKHEAAYIAAMKKKREEAEAHGELLEEAEPADGDISATLETLDQLIDALDGLMKVMPGYLVEGSAMREALQGDPNGDAAPAYVSLLSSQPGVVNFYRERTHMRQLAQDGTISPAEYDHWYLGRREKLAQTAVKKQGTEGASGCGKPAGHKPVLKCTSEKL